MMHKQNKHNNMNFTLKIKSLALALVFSSFTPLFSNDTLMTIGGQPVLLEEFEYIYNKNKQSSTVEKTTLEESLEMFVNYKLKVLEAQSQGMDTLPTFLSEFNTYRTQLAKPYLTDMAMQEKIYRQAYEHLKEDVEVSHVLIRIPQNATPNDTLRAYKRAEQAFIRLLNEPFSEVALEISEDPSVKSNKGYLGYCTGLTMVWPFEQAMYSLKVGHVSRPVRTNYGYHVIKVHSRRPAQGRVRASHIMKACNENMSESAQQKAYESILSLRKQIEEGAKFEEVAKKQSDDRPSAMKGGDLSWFGVGRMVRPFEDAAFSMEVGEVSQPIRTEFGWHIIKLTDKKDLEPYAQKKEDIKRFLKHDDRSAKAQEAFVAKLQKDYKLYKNAAGIRKVEQLVRKHRDNDSIIMAEAPKYTEVVIAFKDNIVQAFDFVEYCVDHKVTSSFNKALNEFADELLLKYEDSQLEKKYPEFRLLMGEYYGGLLLFEISSKEVWDKTTKDQKGVEKYFRKNKKKYAWDSPRYKGTVVQATSDNVAKIVVKKSGTLTIDSISRYVKTIEGEDASFVVDKGLWKKGDNKIVDALVFDEDITKIEKNSLHPVVVVDGKLQKQYPASYKDVRGAVTSDYQTQLEEAWIKSLRKKYPVIINQDVKKRIK